METYIYKYQGHEFEIELYPRERIEELEERLRVGNSKLNKAWDDICKLDHSSQHWNDEVERWHLANVRLSAYCSQLTGMGFRDCLYIDSEGKKYKDCLGSNCRVCPSIISYWEAELMKLPSGGE